MAKESQWRDWLTSAAGKAELTIARRERLGLGLEHDPEKACPRLDSGAGTGFPKKITLKQKDRAG
jgi:hypothetical protein